MPIPLALAIADWKKLADSTTKFPELFFFQLWRCVLHVASFGRLMAIGLPAIPFVDLRVLRWLADAARRRIQPIRERVPTSLEGRNGKLLTGLEPVTSSLPRKCSTTELQQQSTERVKGIEPSYSAWKAAALPLCYTRMNNPEQTHQGGRDRNRERCELTSSGGYWIRTNVGVASGFTVRPL